VSTDPLDLEAIEARVTADASCRVSLQCKQDLADLFALVAALRAARARIAELSALAHCVIDSAGFEDVRHTVTDDILVATGDLQRLSFALRAGAGTSTPEPQPPQPSADR
jgi:hypothetical protein